VESIDQRVRESAGRLVRGQPEVFYFCAVGGAFAQQCAGALGSRYLTEGIARFGRLRGCAFESAEIYVERRVR